MTTFSQRLHVAKAQRGLSIAQLARALNTSDTTIENWLYFGIEPNVSNVRKLCAVLGCTPNELIGWED